MATDKGKLGNGPEFISGYSCNLWLIKKRLMEPLMATNRYFRYVDDIRLMSKDEDSLKLMLVSLDLYSKHIGLFPQSSKIEIHEIKNIHSVDVSIIAAHEVIKLNIKPKSPYADINHVAQQSLKNARIINRASQRPSAIGEFLRFICQKELPNFNWEKVFGKQHDDAENKLVRVFSYVQTDMSAFINIFDVFNELLLDKLFQHDITIGSYDLGHIGSVVYNQNSKFKAKYPDLYNMCKIVHDKRSECDLSHPIKRRTKDCTRPVEYRYIYKLRPIIFKGITEFITNW